MWSNFTKQPLQKCTQTHTQTHTHTHKHTHTHTPMWTLNAILHTKPLLPFLAAPFVASNKALPLAVKERSLASGVGWRTKTHTPMWTLNANLHTNPLLPFLAAPFVPSNKALPRPFPNQIDDPSHLLVFINKSRRAEPARRRSRLHYSRRDRQPHEPAKPACARNEQERRTIRPQAGTDK